MLLKISLMVGYSTDFCSLEEILLVEANSVEHSVGRIGQSLACDTLTHVTRLLRYKDKRRSRMQNI